MDRCGMHDDRERVFIDEGVFTGPFPGVSDDERVEDVRALTPHELGRLGEKVAAAYLEAQGCTVIERNYRCAEGEADLVAHDELDDCIVLVEVKARRAKPGGDSPYPEEAVTRRKRRRYRRITSCYAMDNYPVPSIRFDVVAIAFSGGDEAHLTHYIDVFSWEGER